MQKSRIQEKAGIAKIFGAKMRGWGWQRMPAGWASMSGLGRRRALAEDNGHGSRRRAAEQFRRLISASELARGACLANQTQCNWGQAMRVRPRVCAILAICLAVLTAASCGSGSGPASTATGTASAGPSSGTISGSHPLRGIIVLGHSGLTGENSDPQRLGQPASQNSWATGISPAVDSIYQRLAAVDPATRGHEFNAAGGGAPASSLVTQATEAFRLVPNPRLVMIEIIGPDIGCRGSDSSNYPVFGLQVKEALDYIATQAPHAAILLVSWPGQPLQASKAIIGTAAVPIARANSPSPMCSPFDANLRLDMKHITTWTGIIEGYESELAKVCATVPECHTDNGLAAQFQVRASYYNYSSDWDYQHFNVTGLAALAAFMWPTVAKVLNLH